jgi:flagellar protein FlaJ
MLRKIAFKLFGKPLSRYLGYFDFLEIQLRSTRMKISVHEYMSLVFFASMIAFLVSIIAGSILIPFLTLNAPYSYTLAIIVSFGVTAAIFFLTFYYPSMKANSIKSRIDRALPFSATHMTAIASSGINPAEIFKILSLREGEIGKEAKTIYNDVRMFGMGISAALTKAANRTPSPQFSELLWGMVSVITSGGDLENYLSEKTRSFMVNYKRTLDDYSNQIYLYTEIYITLIIVGTLFFIVLSSIMSPLTGGGALFIQTFLVFVFTPLISVGFIILLKGLSPSG